MTTGDSNTSGPPTRAGRTLGTRAFTPSCPSSPAPHIHSRPSSVTAAVHSAPQNAMLSYCEDSERFLALSSSRAGSPRTQELSSSVPSCSCSCTAVQKLYHTMRIARQSRPLMVLVASTAVGLWCEVPAVKCGGAQSLALRSCAGSHDAHRGVSLRPARANLRLRGGASMPGFNTFGFDRHVKTEVCDRSDETTMRLYTCA